MEEIYLMDKERLRIAICDDKKEEIDRIERVLYRCMSGMKYSCWKFFKGNLLYKANKKKKFYLVILDIEMPDPDGIHKNYLLN